MPKDKPTPKKSIKLDKYLDVLRLPAGIVKKFRPGSTNFKGLVSLKPKERGQVKIYGKLVDVPRTQKSYLRDYTFSGVNQLAEAVLPSELTPFMEWAKTTSYASTGDFNQLLVNWYANGNEYIGAHSDNESQLKKDSEIISISLGATRKFRIRNKETKAIVKDINLAHGDVVVMKAGMQDLFTHEIVKIAGEKGKKVDCRVNITLRKFD